MLESVQNKLLRLERIFDATTEGWWEWNIETDDAYYSHAWYNLLGIEKEANRETSKKLLWESLIHPEDRARVVKNHQIFIQTDEPWHQEFRMLHSDGEYIWILSRGKVMHRSPDGRALLAGGLHINISVEKELQRVSEDLKNQEALIHGILKVSLSSITMIDFIAKRMSFTSGKIMQKLGYLMDEFSELSNNFFSEIIHPDDKPKLQAHVEKLAQSNVGEVLECQVRMQAKTGSFCTILFRDSVFARNGDGEPQEVICSAIDMTHYLYLKSKVQENVRFLEEMSFMSSHDIRGPVATILGLTHLIKKELNTPDSVTEMIGYLEQTVRKMDAVIGDLTITLNKKLNE